MPIITKQAGLSDMFTADWGSAALPLGGLGAGLILRSLLERKNIRKGDDVEDTTTNRLVRKAPLIGLGAGFIASPFWRSFIANKGMSKVSSLKGDVVLRPHQDDAISFLEEHGHGIVAHGTGLGKTLTSIAAFERLKDKGKASKAVVVVPAALRDNFADNISKFTDSKYSIYGPKGEKGSIYYDKPSTTPYNIISYDLYKKDPEGIRERLGADTLIVDEAHRTRNDTSETYSKLRESAERYKNVITLTGSLVNNEPSDISPLIDVTFGKTENAIANKKMFDKLFVRRDVKVKGWFAPVTETTASIINKPQLAKLLADKVHYVSHEDMEKDLPAIKEEQVKVEMSPLQKKLYMYSLGTLDPITRLKIKNNIPVSQREMAGLFAELMQSRKIMTDPAVMNEKLQDQDPYEYSPKVKRVVDDLREHLDESESNKAVIYGNLIHNQLDSVREALDNKGIPYATYFGIGNEGNSSKQRSANVKDYLSGKKRVLLISGAGGEGLDLKGSTMLQMLEGHYNPEKIQQAEARVRRMGDKPEKPIEIKQYVSVLPPSLLQKGLSIFGAKPATTVDEYIYSVADRKDKLNSEFRSVLSKKANTAGYMIGQKAADTINKIYDKRETVGIDAAIKQRLINEQYPEYTSKKHFSAIKRMSGIDERQSMAEMGAALLGLGTSSYIAKQLTSLPVFNNMRTKSPAAAIAIPIVSTALLAAAIGVGAQQGPKRLLRAMTMKGDDIPRTIEAYNEKLDKKVQRKLRSSEMYLDEAERLQRLGLSQRLLEA